MTESTKIQLKTEAVLNIPLQNYQQDFCFIVNGEEFRTSFIISDLLSPEICRYHLIDPTMNTFTINTDNRGNFSYILNLVGFTPISIPISQLPFVIEVLRMLNNNSIDLSQLYPILTESNAVEQLLMNENNSAFEPARISEEIKFISSHFSEIFESQKENLKKLQIDTIERIISDESLQLTSEDHLLSFINQLFEESDDNNRQEYSMFYRYVLFSNVSTFGIQEFLNIFDYNNIDSQTWISISSRLKKDVKLEDEQIDSNRYKNISKKKSKKKKDDTKNNSINVPLCSSTGCQSNALALCNVCCRYFCEEHFYAHDCESFC